MWFSGLDSGAIEAVIYAMISIVVFRATFSTVIRGVLSYHLRISKEF